MPISAIASASVEHTRQLVLQHGWNSTSFQIINPGIQHWFSQDGAGVIGYTSASRIRVVVGAPVCAAGSLSAIARAFEADAAACQESVCYFCAESRLDQALAGAEPYSKFLLGAQPVWNPLHWNQTVAANRSLRAQLNRSRNKGVSVEEWSVPRASHSPELSECLHRWLDAKGLPPLHFMVETDLLTRLEHRRIWVAQHADQIVGFLVLSPVRRRNGWLFELFPHHPQSPNGTVELMIDAAMQTIAADGCSYATLGLSPLSTRGCVAAVNQPLWLTLMLFWMRKAGQRFFNFEGLDAFKAKLKPDHWEPAFAIMNSPRISARTLWAITAAFAGHGVPRMIGATLARRPLHARQPPRRSRRGTPVTDAACPAGVRGCP